MKKVIVTGSAGFIGFHVSRKLLDAGYEVLGIDGLTDYYDVELKKSRNLLLGNNKRFLFFNEMLENREAIEKIFQDFEPNYVVHLAAQAGVRYSIESPESYVNSNLIGSFNILEALRKSSCKHFLMASTSSVYGGNKNMPYSELANTDTQMSFYAATKKSNEVMSHSYAHLFKIPTTCFRFFTVYGPWGRPDMALFKFTKKILSGENIDVYNYGKMKRDFTYIDDLVTAIYKLIDIIPSSEQSGSRTEGDSLSPIAPWRVVNIGSENPVALEKFIQLLEKQLGKKAKKNYLEIQAGDVPFTFSDQSLLKKLIGFQPNTTVEEGIKNFLSWYNDYYEK